MRSDLEVADIFRRHGPAYRLAHDGHIGRVERRVMSAVELCRTAALGCHVEASEDCAHARVAYNSCRHRHCPKCQSATRERWLADRQADLLPVPHVHVAFTVPAEVAEIAFHNKAAVYAILFDAVAATLKTIAVDLRYLGGEIGFLTILHTWGAGAHPPPAYPLPRARRRTRGRSTLVRLPAALLLAHSRTLAPVPAAVPRTSRDGARARSPALLGALAQLADADVFAAAVRQLRRKNWIVYAKPPFGSPKHVLAYLGRYTHRVAIANSCLVSANDSSVVFRWRDYRHGNAPRQMSLDPDEFIRRFLIHSLPDGFHRIRHYGFLANGCRRARLAKIRQLLPVSEGVFGEPADDAPRVARLPRFDPTVCPCCGGTLRITAALPRWRALPVRLWPDTS